MHAAHQYVDYCHSWDKGTLNLGMSTQVPMRNCRWISVRKRKLENTSYTSISCVLFLFLINITWQSLMATGKHTIIEWAHTWNGWNQIFQGECIFASLIKQSQEPKNTHTRCCVMDIYITFAYHKNWRSLLTTLRFV